MTLPAQTEAPSLHQALASIGIFSVQSLIDGRRTLFCDAECIGAFTAHGAWQLYHEITGTEGLESPVLIERAA